MAFTDPFRLRVLKGLTDCLKGITEDNGYAHDLSQAVFRGRIAYGDNDPLPMVSILEAPLPLEQIMANAGEPGAVGPWEILIQGFVDDDPKNPTDPAYHLEAEVRAALAKARQAGARAYNIFGVGACLTDLQIGAPVVRPADELSAKAYFWLPITLLIVETLDDPYS